MLTPSAYEVPSLARPVQCHRGGALNQIMISPGVGRNLLFTGSNPSTPASQSLDNAKARDGREKARHLRSQPGRH
jgi:hypothetical protein